MQTKLLAALVLLSCASPAAADPEGPPEPGPEPPAARAPAPCLAGQLPLLGDDGAAHCCWPGQTFAAGACAGTPACAEGWTVHRGGCLPPRRAAPVAEAPEPAPAEAPTFAAAYKAGSSNLLTSSTLGVNAYNNSSGLVGLATLAFGGDVAYRHIFSFGFALQLRLGLSVLGLFNSTNGGALGILRPGFGLGYAFAPGERVAITPLVTYELLFLFGSGGTDSAHTVALELPVTVFITRAVFVEILVSGGALLIELPFGGFRTYPSFTLGHRFGVSF